MQSFPSSLIYCWHFVRMQQLSHWSRPLLPCCFWRVLAWLKYQHMGHWKQKNRWLQANVGPFNMPLAWTNCHWLFTFRKKLTPAWLDIRLHSKQLKLLITKKTYKEFKDSERCTKHYILKENQLEALFWRKHYMNSQTEIEHGEKMWVTGCGASSLQLTNTRKYVPKKISTIEGKKKTPT